MKRTVSAILLIILATSVLATALEIGPAKTGQKTWVVDDDGPADFHSIQQAVDVASGGDTILVRNGTYHEHLVLYKSLTLTGEDKETTVVDGGGIGTVINITANEVIVSGFRVQNSGIYSSPICSGFCIRNTTGNIVRGNKISQNKGYGVYIETSNNTNVENNIISSNGYDGVLLSRSVGNKITENVIENHQNGYGVEVSSSNGTEISGNTITNITSWGIRLGGYFGVVLNNTVVRNNCGVLMAGAQQNNVSYNTIALNNETGLEIEQASPNNVFRHNNLYGNAWNFGVFAGFLSDFTQDMDPSNLVDGKPVYYLVNEHDKQVPSDAGYVAAVDSSNITVRDSTLTKNLQGVLFAWTTNSTVENVNISNNLYGVHLILASQNNMIRNSRISDNEWRGVDAILGCSSNTISGNKITSTRSYHLTSRPWYMQFGFENRSPVGVCLSISSGSCQIQDNEVTENGIGIHADSTSSANGIRDNSLVNNYVGISLASSNNTIFHNTLIRSSKIGAQQVGLGYSTVNKWDDGYPSGGNYWSDYYGVDKYSGPLQNITGSDGIGDTPYLIGGSQCDNYPMMNSGLEHDLAIRFEAPLSLGPGESSKLNATLVNCGRSNETSVNLLLLVDGNVINSTTVQLVQNGSSFTLRHLWTPTVKGTHNLTAYVVPKETELCIENNQANMLTKFFKYTHDVSVNLNGPSGSVSYVPWLFNATVHNEGSSNETNLEVKLLVNGTVVDSGTIVALSSDTSQSLNFSWSPMVMGNYNVTVFAMPVTGEVDTSDNAESLAIVTHSTIIKFLPIETIVQVGETFTVDVIAADAIDLYDCDVTIFYPNEGLVATDIELGNFPDWCWAQSGGPGVDYNATHGRASWVVATCQGTAGGNGTGTLATITFKAIANGTYTFSVDESTTQFFDSSGRSLWLSTEGGSVEVEGFAWAHAVRIRADGSIDPPDAPISTSDNATYTLTGNITSVTDGISVERDNIMVDGAGYTVLGMEIHDGKGITLVDSINVTVKNMIIESFDNGIYFNSSSNSVLSGNSVTNNTNGLYVKSSLNNTFSANNLLDNIDGIYLSESVNNTLSGNNVTANAASGIHLYSSSGNTLSDNNVTANNGDGVYLGHSSGNTLSGNNVTANAASGIHLYSSSGNTLSDNNVTANSLCGVHLDFSSGNILFENVMRNNQYNFAVEGNALSHYLHWVDTSNFVDDKPICYLVNQSNVMVDADAYPMFGYVGLVRCSNMTVRGLNLTGNLQGILLVFTNNSRITGNNIENNQYGVCLDFSFGNTLSDNNVTANNGDGVYLGHSSGNTLSGNNVTDNDYGVYLELSSNNTISGNNVTGNYERGVWLGVSSGNVLSSNNVANNGYGVCLDFSFGNTLSDNNVTDNDYGVCLELSTGNIFRHNNFRGTSSYRLVTTDTYKNVWDDGCEGNYWSDYKGSDLDDDGVGDTYLPWTDVDNFPLMNVYWNPCDVNHDLIVDMMDVGISAKAFGTMPGDTPWNPHADITGSEPFAADGKVDMRDIALVARNFGVKYL